jgi:hypothetical protein
VPLTPPDPKQCQAEKPNGVTFMTMGGRHKMVRCTNEPVFIVTEKKPGEDGQKGSMSLCASCLAVFAKQAPEGYATITHIKEGEN